VGSGGVHNLLPDGMILSVSRLRLVGQSHITHHPLTLWKLIKYI
jgi:hypothetical protein